MELPAGRLSVENPEGHRLEYEPHDWQVEGVCQSLDGVDLLAITPTGSGKNQLLYDVHPCNSCRFEGS